MIRITPILKLQQRQEFIEFYDKLLHTEQE